jgi:hypothetical protein
MQVLILQPKSQSCKSLGFAVIGREDDPRKLYEVAVIHYGKLEEFEEAGFAKLIAKSAAGSPWDSDQTVLTLHTSLFSHKSPYSRSVLSDPAPMSKFDPSRVWLAPSGLFSLTGYTVKGYGQWNTCIRKSFTQQYTPCSPSSLRAPCTRAMAAESECKSKNCFLHSNNRLT